MRVEFRLLPKLLFFAVCNQSCPRGMFMCSGSSVFSPRVMNSVEAVLDLLSLSLHSGSIDEIDFFFHRYRS